MAYKKCEVNLQSRRAGPCGRTITEDYGPCHLFDNDGFGDQEHKIDISPNGSFYRKLLEESDEYLLKLANDTHGDIYKLCVIHRIAMEMAQIILAKKTNKSSSSTS